MYFIYFRFIYFRFIHFRFVYFRFVYFSLVYFRFIYFRVIYFRVIYFILYILYRANSQNYICNLSGNVINFCGGVKQHMSAGVRS